MSNPSIVLRKKVWLWERVLSWAKKWSEVIFYHIKTVGQSGLIQTYEKSETKRVLITYTVAAMEAGIGGYFSW